MRILFLIPKIEKGSFFGLSLGLCYLSAVLKRNGFRNIIGMDLNLDEEACFESIAPGIEVLGIHMHTKTFSEAVRLANRAKEINPRIKIVAGGPHVTLCPEDVISQESIDFIVIGEGEHTFLELIKSLEDGSELSEIKGIWHKEEGQIKRNLPREFTKDLDEFPFPDRELFDLIRYAKARGRSWFDIPIIASRSCPYHCTNCMPALREIMGPYRLRSVENLISEIKILIKRYGVKVFFFLDNDLSVNREWLIKFCNGFIKEGLRIKWTTSVRINTINRELMVLMKRAGCIGLLVGVESGSQDVIDKVLHKGISLQKAMEAFRIADEVGLYQHAYFMIGIPGETKEQMLKTVDFAKTLNVDSMLFSIGNPMPHTGYEKICKENGWLLGKTWDDYDNPYGRIMIKTDQWGPEFVEEVKEKIYREFEEMNWSVERKRCYVNIPVYNFPKKIRGFSTYRFIRFLGRQLFYFFKNFKPNHLAIILKGIKVRYLQ